MHENSEKSPTSENILPVTAYTFLSWSQIQSDPLSPLNSQWIAPGSATLVVGENASALAINWTRTRTGTVNASKCPLYIKGEAPGETTFTDLLTLSHEQRLIQCKAAKNIELQNFPLSPIDNVPRKILFRWIVVDKGVLPWQHDGAWHKEMSLLEKVLLKEELVPPMIILDGFLWGGQMNELRTMLKRFKQRQISIMILNHQMPPERFYANSIWDNVAEIKPWRTWRCSRYDIVFKYRKYQGCKTNKHFHIISPDGVHWHEKGTDYDFLKPVLRERIKKYTAAQMVQFINENLPLRSKLSRPMTIATLARLKREWGLRTYRPEKMPRKKKSPRNQSDESSSFDAQI